MTEQQEYIRQKVNPILESLVTQLLLERPEHLAQFVIKWLGEQTKTPAAAALTEGVNELSELKSELESLQKEVKQLEEEVGEKAPLSLLISSSRNKAEASDSEEDDDADVDELPPPSSYVNRGQRSSVSAEAYGTWNQKLEFTPPVYPKSEAQKKRIKEVLQKSFMFSPLEQKDVDVVIDAMQEKVVEEGVRIIEQGEDGDCLYVVEEGQINCLKKQPEGEEQVVKSCTVGDAFGELALLYNCPRAASVVAHTKCVMWQLDRGSFNHIVKDAAQQRRERYEKFLKSVPILAYMDPYELTTLCDALKAETINAGSTIAQQGEIGDKFYILEEGEAVVNKVYVKGTPAQEVMKYASGDYFGELSLLSGETRAATIVARTDCKVLVLSKKTFNSALGSMEEILTRNAAQYK